MAILERWLFFRENKQNKEKAELLFCRLLGIWLEVLKNQIAPHFMFNSLNVLSTLIDSNQEKAQQFIEEFSDWYRYVLATIEKPVVTVAQELKFIQSYISLQQMRHNEAIILHDAIPCEICENRIPPFSLAAERLEKMLKELVPDISIAAKLASVESSVAWLKDNSVDLIFLDIQLTDGLSFSIFDRTVVKIPVIFTTAYDQYAIKVFELNSISYPLKSIKKTVFKDINRSNQHTALISMSCYRL